MASPGELASWGPLGDPCTYNWGGLAQEWSALASLEQLGLASNQLSFSVPTVWGEGGSLPALVSLDLSGNVNLCGPLPSNPSLDKATIGISGTGLKTECTAPTIISSSSAPPPPETGLSILTFTVLGKSLQAEDLKQLPLILGAEYKIDHYQLQAQFDVKATSPQQKCDPKSQGSQRSALSETMGLPVDNLRSACSVGGAGGSGGGGISVSDGAGGGITVDIRGLGGGVARRHHHRRHLHQAPQDAHGEGAGGGARRQHNHRHLHQAPQESQAPLYPLPLDWPPESVPACQSVASMDMEIMLDAGTDMGTAQSQVGSYVQAVRAPCVIPHGEDPVQFSVNTALRAVYMLQSDGGSPSPIVECPDWTKAASKAVSAEVIVTSCNYFPPAPPSQPEGDAAMAMNIGIIIGAALAGVLALAGAIVTYLCCYRKKIGCFAYMDSANNVDPESKYEANNGDLKATYNANIVYPESKYKANNRNPESKYKANIVDPESKYKANHGNPESKYKVGNKVENIPANMENAAPPIAVEDDSDRDSKDDTNLDGDPKPTTTTIHDVDLGLYGTVRVLPEQLDPIFSGLDISAWEEAGSGQEKGDSSGGRSGGSGKEKGDCRQYKSKGADGSAGVYGNAEDGSRRVVSETIPVMRRQSGLSASSVSSRANSSSDLAALVDASGKSVSFRAHSSSDLAALVDASGKSVSFRAHSSSDLAALVESSGKSVGFRAHSSSDLAALVDASGKSVSFRAHSSSDLAALVDASGKSVSFRAHSSSDLAALVDASGKSVSFRAHSSSDLAALVDASGKSVSFRAHSSSDLAALVDASVKPKRSGRSLSSKLSSSQGSATPPKSAWQIELEKPPSGVAHGDHRLFKKRSKPTVKNPSKVKPLLERKSAHAGAGRRPDHSLSGHVGRHKSMSYSEGKRADFLDDASFLRELHTQAATNGAGVPGSHGDHGCHSKKKKKKKNAQANHGGIGDHQKKKRWKRKKKRKKKKKRKRKKKKKKS
eukprot:gene21917-28961_t